MSGRGGVTLLELMVVIALLSVIAAVSGLAMQRSRRVSDDAALLARLMAVRDSSLKLGRTLTVLVRDSGNATRRPIVATAYPDGRLLADPSLAIDPLSGHVVHASH